MQYQNVRVDKSLYKSGGGFLAALEKLDPSERYAGSELAGMDAFQRQLKRFGIKVSGAGSSNIAKFFSTGDSAALFPEYVSRAVESGAKDQSVLDEIISAKTEISSMDYRSITTDLAHPGGEGYGHTIGEGEEIPVTNITLNENLVTLKKRGRLLRASYEAIKFQRLDVFTVALKQIGAFIAKAQLKDAMEVLAGSGGNAAEVIEQAGAQLSYADLLALWSKFVDFEMNVLLASPQTAAKVLSIPELRDPIAGVGFQNDGGLGTPLGAKLIKTAVAPEGKIIALDRKFALEMVTAGGVQVEYDKLIDTQLERASVTSICGFSKLFPDAVKVLNCK
ncbi:MAG: phage major capsid protein [Oscillospiraceae bacterium]|nr:phage major capsid protein [Oscillospiraceae bacterium]